MRGEGEERERESEWETKAVTLLAGERSLWGVILHGSRGLIGKREGANVNSLPGAGGKTAINCEGKIDNSQTNVV